MAQDSWIGKTIKNRYQIKALLGKGGMSAVYRATDPNLRRDVAIKLIHTHLSDNPEFVRRFEEEAAAVARLRHPNIIQVHDFDHEGDVYYIVFEYIPGETLQQRLSRLSASGQRLLLSETIKIMTSVGRALAYAHDEGLVHRDIKPANIMINKREEAILMDFGIAKISGADHHTATGMVLGTARYMSPEQVMGETIDARTDLYALGITLFEMVNGRPPFESDSVAALMMMHVNEPVPDLAKLRPDIPPTLVAVIDKALAKKRAERYQSAAAFVTDLRQAAQESAAGVTTVENAPLASAAAASSSITTDATIFDGAETGHAPEPAPPPQPAPSSSRNRLLLAGGAVALLIFIAACAAIAFVTIRGQMQATSETTSLSAGASFAAQSTPSSANSAVWEALDADPVQEDTISNAVDPASPNTTTQDQQAGQTDGETVAANLADAVKESNNPGSKEDGQTPASTFEFDPLFLTSYSYQGLIVGLALPEADTERVLFSIDDPQPTIDNGTSRSGTLTLANNSIGPIPHEKGEHTLYIQYIDADGDPSEIYSFDYSIDDIVFNYNALPYDFETQSTPVLFTMAVVDGDTDALYTFAYSVDADTLDQQVDGVAEAGVIQIENLQPGEHTLYVQAGSPNHQTGVVEYPFMIE